MFNSWLYKRIDNTPLICFRILFGVLLALEAFGAIFTGWVRKTFIKPDFTFNFIGFEFLQPLPGNLMLWYFTLMGVFGIFVMLGFKYRFSMMAYSGMWAAVYLMQKSSYNNHYYLLMLLNFIMVLLPAHRYFSLDVKLNPSLRKVSMPRWCQLLIITQLWIVYTYAAVAKLYPDWWDGTFPKLLMGNKTDIWFIGEMLQQPWTHYTITYFGFLFDLLIIPLMLWKRTRVFAFVVAVFFHLFNSFVLHIGIFPYLALALLIFFFPAKTVHKYFLGSKPFYEKSQVVVPHHNKFLLSFLVVWTLIQLALPARHWFFKDDVLWTEEGHRLSWRMMLRSRSGRSMFMVVDKKTKDTILVDNRKFLTKKQIRGVGSKPDLIWQFAQYLERWHAERGKQVEVYVDSKVSLNGRPLQRLIDPEVDLAEEDWQHFSHHNWILPSSLDK